MKNIFLVLLFPLVLHAQPAARMPVLDSMYQFDDNLWGYKVSVPTKMVYSKPAVQNTSQGFISHLSSCSDDHEKASYLFGVNCVPEGVWIADDSSYYESMKETLKQRFSVVTYDTTYTIGEYHVLFMHGKVKADGRIGSARLFVRGNKIYVQAVDYSDPNGSDRVTAFFRSFSPAFLPWAHWQKVATPDGSFSTWAPAPFNGIAVEPKLKKAGFTDIYVSYDSARANCFSIQCSNTHPYYWSLGFPEMAKVDIAGAWQERDTLLYSRATINGTLKGWEWAKRNGHSDFYFRKRFVIDGERVYSLLVTGPLNEIFNADANRFFDDFQRMRPAAGATHLFDSKAVALLDALYGSDQQAALQAAGYVGLAPFAGSDLAMLQRRLLETPAVLKESKVHAAIRNCILRIGDSSSFRFAADHYLDASSSEDLKENLLVIMEHFPSEAHYREIARLLQASPLHNIGFEHFFWFGQNLHLSSILLPQLLHFIEDSTARPFIVDMAGRMLDSNLITAATIRAYYPVFLQYAQHEIAYLSTDYGTPRTFDLALMSILGVINTPEAIADLREFFGMEFDELRVKAFAALLHGGHQTAADIQTMASNKATRVEAYQVLLKAGKQSLFPAAFLKQQLFGESMVYNEIVKVYPEPPASVDLISTKTMGGKRFYFYTVKEKTDDRFPLLTCAGPFSADAALGQVPARTIINWRMIYIPANADSQMNALMAAY